jgi:hypothetical protein
MGMAQEWLVYPKKWMSRYDSRGNFRVGPLVFPNLGHIMDASHTTLMSGQPHQPVWFWRRQPLKQIHESYTKYYKICCVASGKVSNNIVPLGVLKSCHALYDRKIHPSFLAQYRPSGVLGWTSREWQGQYQWSQSKVWQIIATRREDWCFCICCLYYILSIYIYIYT